MLCAVQKSSLLVMAQDTCLMCWPLTLAHCSLPLCSPSSNPDRRRKTSGSKQASKVSRWIEMDVPCQSESTTLGNRWHHGQAGLDIGIKGSLLLLLLGSSQTSCLVRDTRTAPLAFRKILLQLRMLACSGFPPQKLQFLVTALRFYCQLPGNPGLVDNTYT